MAGAQAVSPLLHLRLAAADIRLAHTVFAMPFALLGAFLARPATLPAARFAAVLALIVLCMIAARTWAMLVNRLADRRLDAVNPRTARRPLASGALPVRAGLALAAASALLFALTCTLFIPLSNNPWPAFLALPVLAWIALYSFTKRFTAACHFFLGSALAISPLAAALAVDPASLTRVPALYPIAGMVLLWVAGFDVIYALQDIDFDRSARVHSIPAALGWRRAILLSRGLHAASAALLLLAWTLDPRLGPLFLAGCTAVAALLVFEHLTLARRGQAGLQTAFFTANGLISLALGLAGIADSLP